MPEALQFATKPAIALRQIEHLLKQVAPRQCVLTDAGYVAARSGWRAFHA